VKSDRINITDNRTTGLHQTKYS